MRSREEVEVEIRRIIAQVKEIYESGYQNSEPFQQRMHGLVDSQMHTFHENGDLHEYKIICDATNNDPSIVDTDRFRLIIAVKWDKDHVAYSAYTYGYDQAELNAMSDFTRKEVLA